MTRHFDTCATLDELKKSYRTLCKELHPDAILRHFSRISRHSTKRPLSGYATSGHAPTAPHTPATLPKPHRISRVPCPRLSRSPA